MLVEGDRGYRVAKDFMKMIMPSHAKNVQHYTDTLPLFARYQVESYLSSMFNPTVQLKSGGYIVIDVTEALVAIDVNSGRATKEGSIEETALKTNLEAAEEVARQLRLRDLAGLIVIDFIDMEERKNNAAVEKKMKDKLKTDRARIQVGRISGFGLLEMSRQRLRPGMIEATTQPCPHCHGTGLIRSDDNLALNILRQMEEEGTRGRSREVLLKAPIGIVNYLVNHKREHIAQIEMRYGMGIRLEADPFLISPDFSLEKLKTATRAVPEAAPVVSVDATLMDPLEEDVVEEEAEVIETPEVEEGEEQPKKKRRRRRRKPRSKSGTNGENGEAQNGGSDASEAEEAGVVETAADDAVGETSDAPRAETGAEAAEETGGETGEEKPKPRSRSRSRSRSRKKKTDEETVAGAEVGAEPPAEAAAEAAPADDAPAEAAAEAEAPVEEAAAEEAAADTAPAEVAAVEELVVAEAAVEAAVVDDAPAEEVAVEIAAAEEATPAPANENAAAEDDKPKKKGWWSLGR